ncbi:receptor-transporting protein 4 [Thomomys bottae]
MLDLDDHKWEQKFQERMRQEIPWVQWTLKLAKNITPDFLPWSWTQYQQRAFGRFLCKQCNQSWTSAQINVLCHINLDHQKSQGRVLLRSFGQKCLKCSSSRFENPEFSKKGITRILKNLAQYILHVYYGHDFEEVLVIWEMPLDGAPTRGNVVGFYLSGPATPKTKSSRSLCSSEMSPSSSSRLGDLLIPKLRRPLIPADKLIFICIVMFALIMSLYYGKSY